MSNYVNKLAGAAIGAGAFGALMSASLYTVDAGHRGIIWDRIRGVQQAVYSEGSHLLVPVLQRAIIYDVRTRPRLIANQKTGTRDLQIVNISLRVLSRPEESRLPQIYQELGIDYDERVLPSIANEILKGIVAQYNADQLLTLRDKVSLQIKEGLTDRASDFGIMLDDVAITELSYSKEFAKAVEQKQVAQQYAERAKFIVMRTEQEREAAVIRAKGESQAAEMISEAIEEAGRGLVDIRRIEAAAEIASTLTAGNNITYLPSGNMLYGISTD